MPRPRLFRKVGFNPNVTYFKPAGVRMIDLDETILTVDEFESVRLKDFENKDQEECAKKMKISQPTFSRLLESGRKKIAQALVKGHAIRIQGGNYTMAMPRGRGLGMGRGAGFGGGRGRMGGFGMGPGGICKCPKCGYEEPQIRGQPCMSKPCPKCGTLMTRG